MEHSFGDSVQSVLNCNTLRLSGSKSEKVDLLILGLGILTKETFLAIRTFHRTNLTSMMEVEIILGAFVYTKQITRGHLCYRVTRNITLSARSH